MMFWASLIAMTALAVLFTLWPLIFRKSIADNAHSEIAFYLTQLNEVERDIERGLLPQAEAEAARAEMGRRLIGLQKEKATVLPFQNTSAPVRMALAFGLITLPLLSVMLYAQYGHPGIKDMPLSAREDVDKDNDPLVAALAKVEADIVRNPDNIKAWRVLAPVYLQLGRSKDAVLAYGKILQIAGEDATVRAQLGEAKVVAANGLVSDEAKADFTKALEADPSLVPAKFYLALATEQAGDRAGAIALYENLLGTVTDRPNWAKAIQKRLALLKNEPVQNKAPAADEEMILGMVNRLATRLETEGGSVEDWGRLIRSYSVIAQKEKAEQALQKARTAFAGDAQAMQYLQTVAKEFALVWR